MEMSEKGLNLIKKFEGFVPKPYNDPVGHCTVGYGTLLHNGKCNGTDPSEQAYLNGIDEQQATRLLLERANEFQRTVNESVTVDLNQNQYDSLVSFVYNIGSHGFKQSTLLKLLNQGNYEAVPAEMRKWVYGTVNGKKVVLPGLENRRKAEAEFFAADVSTTQSISNYRYSKPLYDTGEHSLVAQYVDSVVNAPIASVPALRPEKFYSINGVEFTYGPNYYHG
jgi:GH24 family phage-related lysozyme (muramidase)